MPDNDPMDLDAAEVNALMGRLSEISNRTNQMTLDALLRAVPSHDHGFSGAAAAAKALANRIEASASDLQEKLPPR